MTVFHARKSRVTLPAATLVAALALQGCESLPDMGEFSNELIGGALGGLGCAAVAKLSGSSDRDAAIAAAVCAVAGAGVTRTMENRRKQFSSDEQFYEVESNRLANYEQVLTRQIDSAEAELERDRARVASLIDGAERSNARGAELRQLNDRIARRTASLEKDLEEAEEQRDYHKGLIARMRTTKASIPNSEMVQLARLERSVANLGTLVEEHETQSASLGALL